MRHFFSFTCLMVVFMPGLVMAEDVSVSSEITAATVYSDRATVTRTATLDIPAGAHNLVFNGLPLSLFADSLRVSGTATAGVSFGALTHKRESFEDYVVPKEKELNAQLRTLKDQKSIFLAEKKSLDVSKTFVENLGKSATLRENENIAKLQLDPRGWAAAADGLSNKMAKILKSSLELDFKVRETNEKISKLENELQQLRTGQKQSYSVSIPFEAEDATTLTVALNYQLPNVGWYPVYDARLDVKAGTLDLVQYGSVWQRTGEDWDDVALTLSTAQPSRGTGLPDLYPNWLSLYENAAQKGGKNLGMAAPAYVHAMEERAEMDVAMLSSARAPAATLKREVVQKTAIINTEGFVGEYIITGPATVTSDGSQSKLLIGSFETKQSLEIQVKPQLSNEAYLVSKVTLQGDSPVLPGQVNLFRDGAFIGKTHVKMLRPKDEVDLAFGIDDNVVVSRNSLKDEESESGLITKETSIERHFVTEVKNLHKEPMKVAVLETIPSSKDERIRVEIIQDKTTGGYETDIKNVKGVTGWMLELKPQENTSINLGWKVTWPKGQNISGL